MSDRVYIPEPKTCDVCTYELGKPDVQAHYDARTYSGQWANVCEAHFASHTPGVLGTGLGQRLIVGRPPASERNKRIRRADNGGTLMDSIVAEHGTAPRKDVDAVQFEPDGEWVPVRPPRDPR